MRIRQGVIIILMFFLMVVFVNAQGSKPNSSALNVTADGGNITEVNIFAETQTSFWYGLVGKIAFISPTGPNATASGGDINFTDFTVDVSVPVCPQAVEVNGFLLFSNSSTAPIGLVQGNSSVLDDFLLASTETANATFNTSQDFIIDGNTITNVPTTFPFVNNVSQSSTFAQGYLNDASGNLVFALTINTNTTGYNSSLYDVQALLPTRNTTNVTFFMTANLNITCPSLVAAAEAEGGRGSSGRFPRYSCLMEGTWTCSAWGSCKSGLQTRDCTTTPKCQAIGVIPSSTKECEADDEKAFEIQKPANIKFESIEAFVGLPVVAEFTINNPNSYSMEQVTATINLPKLLQYYKELHEKSYLYPAFGIIPIGSLYKEIDWHQISPERFRLNPREEKTAKIKFMTPIIKPQIIKTDIEGISGGVEVATKAVDINIISNEFAMAEEHNKKNTEIQFLIDNTDKPARKVNIELDFNKGRSTLFTELYTVDLPEYDYGIYGFNYRIKFDYDGVKARYKKHVMEAK